jgi:hypothetical protein
MDKQNSTRNALITQCAEQLYQYRVALTLGKPEVDNLFSYKVSDDIKAILLREFTREVSPQLENRLNIDECVGNALRKLDTNHTGNTEVFEEYKREVSPNISLRDILGNDTQRFAEAHFISYSEVKAKLDNLSVGAEEYQPLIEFARKNDEMVRRLSELTDLEKVIDEDLQARVIREIFPERDDYLNHLLTGHEYFNRLEQALNPDYVMPFTDNKDDKGILVKAVTDIIGNPTEESERRYIRGFVSFVYKYTDSVKSDIGLSETKDLAAA